MEKLLKAYLVHLFHFQMSLQRAPKQEIRLRTDRDRGMTPGYG
jgi:hypothetical protein